MLGEREAQRAATSTATGNPTTTEGTRRWKCTHPIEQLTNRRHMRDRVDNKKLMFTTVYICLHLALVGCWRLVGWFTLYGTSNPIVLFVFFHRRGDRREAHKHVPTHQHRRCTVVHLSTGVCEGLVCSLCLLVWSPITRLLSFLPHANELSQRAITPSVC